MFSHLMLFDILGGLSSIIVAAVKSRFLRMGYIIGGVFG